MQPSYLKKKNSLDPSIDKYSKLFQYEFPKDAERDNE